MTNLKTTHTREPRATPVVTNAAKRHLTRHTCDKAADLFSIHIEYHILQIATRPAVLQGSDVTFAHTCLSCKHTGRTFSRSAQRPINCPDLKPSDVTDASIQCRTLESPGAAPCRKLPCELGGLALGDVHICSPTSTQLVRHGDLLLCLIINLPVLDSCRSGCRLPQLQTQQTRSVGDLPVKPNK